MLPKSCRRFHCRDGLLVIAAAAACCAVEQDAIAGIRRFGLPAFRSLSDQVAFWVVELLPSLAVLSAAVLMLRAMPPRPPLRTIVKQAGTVACGVAVLVLSAGIAVAELSGQPWERFLPLPGTPPIPLEIFAGSMVALAWLALAVSRRLRVERSWVDRTGRILGAAWVGVTVAYPAIASWF